MFFLQPNQKRLLNSLNPVFLVLFVVFLILVRTTAEPLFPSVFRQWDLLLPFMVYFGQRRSLAEGMGLALLTSHLYSTCSSAPLGVFSVVYLVIFFVARLVSYAIFANTWVSIFLLMLGLALLERILLTLVSSFFGHGWPFFSSRNLGFWSLLINAGVGYLTYRWLEVLDRMTFKVPRTSIELSEAGL